MICFSIIFNQIVFFLLILTGKCKKVSSKTNKYVSIVCLHVTTITMFCVMFALKIAFKTENKLFVFRTFET